MQILGNVIWDQAVGAKHVDTLSKDHVKRPAVPLRMQDCSSQAR